MCQTCTLSIFRPFQRTAEDIGVMYKVLKTFPQFANMVSSKVLRELCFVAQIDVWKEEDFPGM